VAIGLNLVCGTATVVAVFAVADRLAGRRAARIAAVLVALFPSLILYTATAHLETVFCFLVAVIAWLLVRWSSTVETAGEPREPGLAVPPWPALIALGAVFATATMIRPITLAFLPVLGVAWCVGRPGWARGLGAIAVVGAIVALAVVPWSVRSSRALNGTVVISTNTGDNLCIGHSPESRGEYIDLNALCGGGYDDVPEDRREAERNRRGTSRALTYAREHPVREVTLLGRKAFHLVAHDHEGVDAVESYGADPFLGDTARTLLRVVADGFYYLVGLAALVGAAWTAWRGDSRSRLVLGWAVTLLLVPLVFFGGSRFHLPALPFAAVFAAMAVDRFAPRSPGPDHTDPGVVTSPG
jgi:4-amino-4-deoxy-L-arabinose transferase-like glycosyltransferase